MKKYLLMICLTVMSVSYVSAQVKKRLIVQDPKQTKVDAKARGAAIKVDKPTTDVAAPAPAQRGSTDFCTITFDNYTGYWINVYVDGNYKGDVAPYGVGDVTVYGGYTTYYCVTAGGTYSWSDNGDCSGDYHINLK